MAGKGERMRKSCSSKARSSENQIYAASIFSDVKLPSFNDSEDPDNIRDTSVWPNASFLP